MYKLFCKLAQVLRKAYYFIRFAFFEDKNDGANVEIEENPDKEASLKYIICRIYNLKDICTRRGNQLEHSIRVAESLKQKGADDYLVAAALLQDIGKAQSEFFHPDIGAKWLQGHVHPEVLWVVKWHIIAQHMDCVPELQKSKIQLHQRYKDLKLLCEVDVSPVTIDKLPEIANYLSELRAAASWRAKKK